ncbi:LysR family transcriptional regulator, partial [Fodinicola feengrottensis]|uniref:LysR family transcriptional regulator n=1 Tax=Fodinicola feengrottensis TaxID=435914 RepID=UPI0013D309A3
MTRAATRLNMTQQAVSGQIRQLERIAGTALLLRLPQGVELTPAGEVVAKQGAALVAAATTMLSEAHLLGEGKSHRLRIAFKGQSTAHFMPDVEAALRRVAPEVVLEPLSVSTLPDEIDALVNGAADAAFLWLPIGDDDRFTSHDLISEPRMVALCPGHPLAARTELRIADLANEPIVGYPAIFGPEGRSGRPILVHRPSPGRTPDIFGPEGR